MQSLMCLKMFVTCAARSGGTFFVPGSVPFMMLDITMFPMRLAFGIGFW